MKTVNAVLIIIVMILIVYVLGTRGTFQADLDQQGKKLEESYKQIALLQDTIGKVSLLVNEHKMKRVKAEKEAGTIRRRYAVLRAAVKNVASARVDTLKIIVNVCDSTVNEQDSLIAFLNTELNDNVKLVELLKAKSDTAQNVGVVLAGENKMVKKELRRQRLSKIAVGAMGLFAGLLLH